VKVADRPCASLPYRIPLPVRDGTLVVTFVNAFHSVPPSYENAYMREGLDFSVPAGDGSEALMVSKDGGVSPFPSWPNVPFSDRVVSTDGVLWAMTVRSGMPGNFVLRVPLAGTPEYFLVPGTKGCRGDNRFSYPAKLVEEGASADEVTVEFDYSDHLAECLAKGAKGRYRLRTPGARWSKQPGGSGEGLGTRAGHAKAGPVKVGSATLRIEGTRVLITGPGTEGERDADPDPPGDPAVERELVVTEGSREVWLQTRWKTHCRLGRYHPDR